MQAIDETIRYCLGEINTQLIYDYLEKKQCPRSDIPKNLDVFTAELENLIGPGKGQILGAAKIMEKAIIKVLCAKLEINLSENSPSYFPDQIRNLKETYTQQKFIHSKPKSEMPCQPHVS